MSISDCSVVVLAGTYQWSGSRFQGLAPRPLVPVAQRPLISYALRWARKGGLRSATVCANHASRAVEAALGHGAELDMDLRYHEDFTPRGAAGCVRDAGLGAGSDTLVVADGTAIPTVDLRELLAWHRASGAAVTAVVHRSPSAPPIPSGVYVFERRVLSHIPDTGFQDIKEFLIPTLHRAGERVVAHETDGICPRVLNAQTYLAVNRWMLERLACGGQEEGEEPLVHPSAWVETGARLVGPVQLGPRVRVRAGAMIVGPSSIGADSTVGRNAVVASSAVWRGCLLGEGSLLHGCVVGDGGVVPPASRLFHVVRAAEASRPSVRSASLFGWRSRPPSPATHSVS
jgi:mannose-1-phosphate guanylyltransferase/phosphomannomutase